MQHGLDLAACSGVVGWATTAQWVAQRRPHAGDEECGSGRIDSSPPASKPNVVPKPTSAIASSGLLAIIGVPRAPEPCTQGQPAAAPAMPPTRCV